MNIADMANFGQLAAYLATVFLFLSHMDKKDQIAMKVHQDCETRIAAVANESRKVAEKCLAAFQENTKAIAHFQETMYRIETKV